MLAPGPVVKLATTRSSKESVNASNHPDNIAGNITGAVIFQKSYLELSQDPEQPLLYFYRNYSTLIG